MARVEKAGGAAPGRPQAGARKATSPAAARAAKAVAPAARDKDKPAPRTGNGAPRGAAPPAARAKAAPVKVTAVPAKPAAKAATARPVVKAGKAAAPAAPATPASRATRPPAATVAAKAGAAKAAKPTAVPKAAPAAGAKGTQLKERAVTKQAAKAVPAKAGGDGNGSVPAAAKAPAAKAPAGAAKPSGGAPKTAAPAAKAPARKEPPRRSPTMDKFLLEQRQLLLDERGTHVRQAESLKEEADALAAEMEPGESEFGEEGGEGGNLSIERELDLVLSAQAKAAVDEIDRALVKIDAGTYGLCEKCGKEIPRARLKALPHAPLCVACKSGGLSRR